VPRIRPPITPEQCRRARVLLDWDWSDLAAVDSAEGAVAANRLEGGYDLDHGQLVAIRRVFEAAGIEFLSDGTVRHREPAR
jgi:hypothetical protein